MPVPLVNSRTEPVKLRVPLLFVVRAGTRNAYSHFASPLLKSSKPAKAWARALATRASANAMKAKGRRNVVVAGMRKKREPPTERGGSGKKTGRGARQRPEEPRRWKGASHRQTFLLRTIEVT